MSRKKATRADKKKCPHCGAYKANISAHIEAQHQDLVRKEVPK